MATMTSVISGHRQYGFTLFDERNSSMTATKTTTMTTRKLYGKDLSEYEKMDVDELLSQLTPEELDILSREVDPDDELLPPDQRTSYMCDKNPTGPLNRKQLIDHINKLAIETPDRPEMVPYVAGTVRGKKFTAPEKPKTKQEEEIAIDLGDEYEHALTKASEEELVDLAAILGFHSMMNQEQYNNALLGKEQPKLGWNGIAKAYQPKALPFEPPNLTDVEKSIQQVRDDDYGLNCLNFNNIQISDQQFANLFEGLKSNTNLESLSLCNTGMTDRTGILLAGGLSKNSTLRTINVETNNLSPSSLVAIIKSLLSTKYVEEFRASNQRQQTLGNKIEMEITNLLEQNPTILRVGLHLEYNDARNRIACHLQRNLDRIRLKRISGEGGESSSSTARSKSKAKK
ncbi:tropomodulin isoform X4 [Folsomia candida]|uniref:tropomodulin isoform X4 n=1 Tax=Folsomia candida TaxID=158441 RepID=UPI000B9013DC|nr:tropomodulin isoform X4 [Folsomia candida]